MSELVMNALLCCDRVITENNGKKGLIGIFHSFRFRRLPAAGLPWFVYCALGNVASGSHQFTLNITHDETSSVHFSREGDIEVPNPREDIELVLPVMCQFARYGTHNITLHFDGEMVASRVLRILEPD